jgi:hypothetical protein
MVANYYGSGPNSSCYVDLAIRPVTYVPRASLILRVTRFRGEVSTR